MPQVVDLVGTDRAAGALMLIGAAVFFSAFPIAVLRPELRSADAADFSVRLRAIVGNSGAWRAIFLLFGTGMIFTATAFVLLALDAHGRDEDVLAPLAAVSYLVGVVAMILSLGFHAGPEILAAQTIAETGEVPPWYKPLERWASALYTVYMTLAFSALVLVAVSLWRTNSIAPPLALAGRRLRIGHGSLVRDEVALAWWLQPGGPPPVGSCVGDFRRGGSRIRELKLDINSNGLATPGACSRTAL